MSGLQVFAFEGAEVRSLTVDGEPWFHHGDVCKILRHTNPSVAARMLDDDESALLNLREISAGQTALNTFRAPTTGNAEARFVTEPGLYTLVFNSRAPGAPAFRRWITHEVIPQIRKTGSYSPAPREMTKLEALQAAIESETARLAAEARVKELAPSAAAWDVLASTSGDFSLRDAAFVLNRDAAISTGQQRLMKFIRALGMVDRNGVPYAKHNMHLTERIQTYRHPHTGEETLARPQIRITTQGMRYLHSKLGGTDPLDFEALGEAS